MASNSNGDESHIHAQQEQGDLPAQGDRHAVRVEDQEKARREGKED